MWIEGHPSQSTSGFDLLNRAVQMGAGLQMNGDNIGPGFDKLLDIALGFFDHQMAIHHFIGEGLDGLEHRKSEGDVGHKTAIHHIHMDPIGFAFMQELDVAP